MDTIPYKPDAKASGQGAHMGEPPSRQIRQKQETALDKDHGKIRWTRA